MLVLLELTFERFAWTFNFAFDQYLLAGILWMLGICIIILAGLLRFSTRTIGIFGLFVNFSQQLIALVATIIPVSAQPKVKWFFQLLWTGGHLDLGHGGPRLMVLYSIIPWIGVMAAGYAFASRLNSRSYTRDDGLKISTASQRWE